MKKFSLLLLAVALVTVSATAIQAQGGTGREQPSPTPAKAQPKTTKPSRGDKKETQDPVVVRDPDMEKDSLHNLEVARQYFNLRKAYVAALQRCEEILAGHPTFSRFDEALFIAGESSLYLSIAKGKQAPSLYVRHDGPNKITLTPQQFREDARDYLSQLVNDFPESKFKDEALEDLKSLGGLKPKQ